MPDNVAEIKLSAQLDEARSAMESAARSISDSLNQMSSSLQSMSDQSKQTADSVVAGNKQVADSFKSFQDQVGGALTGIQGAIQSVMGSMGTLMGVLAGGAVFADAISATTKWATEVSSLARMFGVSTEKASDFNAAAHLIGKSAGEAESSMMQLTRTMRTQPEILDQLGVKYKSDVTGSMLDSIDIFNNAINVIKEYKEGMDQQIISMALFKRGAQEMLDWQKLTNDIQERGKQIARDYGLELSQNGVDAARKYKVEMGALGVLFIGIKNQIGEALLPALTSLAAFLNEVGPGAAKVFGTALQALITVCDALVTALGTLAGFLSAVARTAVESMKIVGEAISGAFTASGSDDLNAFMPGGSAAGGEDRAAAERSSRIRGSIQETEAIWLNEIKRADAAISAQAKRAAAAWSNDLAPEGSGGGPKSGTKDAPDSLIGKGGKGGGSESAKDFMAYNEEWLKRIKDTQEDLTAWTTANDYQFWNRRLAEAKSGSEEWWTIWHHMADEYRTMLTEQTAANTQRQKNDEALAKGTAAMEKDNAETAIKISENRINTLYSMEAISAGQKYSMLKAEYDKEYGLEVKALYDHMAVLQQGSAESINVWEQIEKAHNRYLLKMQKDEDSYLLETKRKWDGYATQVGNALTSVLFKHQTVMQTMQSYTEKAFSYIIDTLLKKMVTAWLNSETAKTVGTSMGSTARTAAENTGFFGQMLTKISASLASWFGLETGKTAATTTGAAARTAEEATAAAASRAMRTAANIGEITADAAVAFAGTFAFLSPFMGPAAAGPAAASMAEVMAMIPMASLDVGAWRIPGDMLAKVHQGEMVVPATFAEGLRSGGGMGGGAGGGDLHVHSPQFHFHGDAWEDGIRKNPDALFRAIERGIRNHHFKWQGR